MEQVLELRDAQPDDAQAIVDIYNHYVVHSTISFEEDAVTAAEMQQRIATVQETGLPWIVAVIDGKVMAYAYATKWRVRPAYRYSVESSVYVSGNMARRGLGQALYSALLQHLTQADIHLVIGGIALPNESSVALHEKFGFEKVAHFSEVG